MTCLIIGRCAAASENFNDVLIHARGAIASSDREREFSWLGGRHSFTVEVGFSSTSARSYRLSWNSMDSRVHHKTWLNVNTCRRQLDINTSRIQLPEYINEDDNDNDNDDDDDGMTRCVCTNILGYIFNYILPSLTRPYYGVIRHATARTSATFVRVPQQQIFIVSHTMQYFFLAFHPRTLSYPDASTFLPNAAPCNLWADHWINSLIESTWHGRSLFRASARMPCGVSSDNGISYFSSVHHRVFENEVVPEFCISYWRSSSTSVRIISSAFFSFSSYGSARNAFFIISDWSCNLTLLWYWIISSVIHNLLSFTKFLPCPRAEIFARFLRNIIILYISTIFIRDGFDFYINAWRNLSSLPWFLIYFLI